MATYSFTHTLNEVSISDGTMVVTYIPDDTDLSNYTLSLNFLKVPDYRTLRDENNNLLYADNDSVPFSEHYNYSVNIHAPHDQWDRQKYMLNNATELQTRLDS